jgi:hypothetical protein
LPTANIALEGKRFQVAEDIKENVTAELNAVTLEAFADCFHSLLKDSTYIVKQEEIILNRNKTIFYFLAFVIPFFTPVLELR